MATKKPSLKELTAKLQGVSSAAKSLGINTSKADAMVAQTERQGGKSFAGSREEKAYTKAQAESGGVGVISSNQGKSLVKTADETMSRLAPAPIVTTGGTAVGTPTTPATGGTAGAPVTSTGTTTEPKQKDTAGNFVTYYNEKTGQEQTLRGDAITTANKQALEQSGYTIASADTSTDTTEMPEITALKAQVTTGQTAIDGFMKKLEASLITDKELRGDIRTISQGYAARMDEARQITEQRKQTIQTLGIRTGARYTGGSGGIMGGILSEEERQGLMRIESIENDKQDAILAAKKAARDQNFTLYTTLAQKAEKMQEKKATELQALKKAQAEQDAKIAEETRKSLAGAVVSDLINKGVTSSNDIYSKLSDPSISAVIGSVDPEQFKKIMDALLPTGTGIIGEYEYYKREAQRMGQTPLSFDDYQTRDANRKRPVTNISMGAGNIPNQVVTQIDKLSSSFDSSPIVKNYVEIQNKKLSMDSILTSGIKGPGDLAIVFEFMKALDPTSVVREQEYENASKSGNIFAGAMARFNGYFDPNGGFLPDSVKNDFQSIINQKLTVADSQYQNLRNETARKIEMKTKQYDPNTPGTDYLTDYGGASTGQQIMQDEVKAEQKLTQVYNQYSSQIDSLLQSDPSLSNSDVLQILGIPL